MRSGFSCLPVIAAAILPGLAAERADFEIDLAVPPGGAFRFEALVVPGAAGAEFIGERGESDIEFRIRLSGKGLQLAGTGTVIPCDPGAEHSVSVLCVARQGMWEAEVRVAEEGSGRVIYAGTMALRDRPQRIRARAGRILGAQVS